MRLTREQIADIRRDAPLGPDANLDLSEIGALCDMADELLDADADSNIRDLRDICETLAKRIAALEGFNWHIPHTFTPSSFWRASTKSMSHDERKEERRRYWVADRRQCEPYVMRVLGESLHYIGRNEWARDKRQGPKDRRIVMTCTYGRAFWRTSTNEVSIDERVAADRRSGGPTNGTYMRDGVTYPGRRNGHDRRNAGAPTCVTSFLRDKQMVKDERKQQRRQCEPKGGWGFFLSGDRWVIDSRRHDGKDRRKAK